MFINIENYITILYSLIVIAYTSHLFHKRHIDFILLCIFYLCLSIIYTISGDEKSKFVYIKYDTNKNMTQLIAIAYFVSFLIYIKHIYYPNDLDYVLLCIALLIVPIGKYNIITHNNHHNITLNEFFNIASFVGISIIMGKHAFLHSDNDYYWIVAFYLIHTVTIFNL